MACAGPFDASDLYAEVKSAGAYQSLTRAQFDACLDFVATTTMRSVPTTATDA